MESLPNKKIKCHKTGFSKSCFILVTTGVCDRWMHIRGQNPNTGVDVDAWRCIDDWIPMLLIENSKLQRETGAAVESFRNEMVRMNDRTYQQIADARNDHDVHGALPVRGS